MSVIKQQTRLKRNIFKLLLILFFFLSLCSFTANAETIIHKKADPSRKFTIIVLEIDSDLPEYYKSFLKLKIENAFFSSHKFELINRDDRAMKRFKDELVYKKHCKTIECALRTIAHMAAADIGVTIKAFRFQNGKYFVLIKAIAIENMKTIYIFKNEYNEMDDITKNLNSMLENLKTEIPIQYYKKDFIIDYEVQARAVYVYNTGTYLDSELQGGWGGLLNMNFYLNWYNFFVTTELGYYQCRGKYYYEDIAHYFPFSGGMGYMFRIPKIKLTLSPSLGLGYVISHLYHGKNVDFKRGFTENEYSSITSGNAFCKIGFTTAYQITNFRIFTDVSDYITVEKKILQRVVFGLGVAYML